MLVERADDNPFFAEQHLLFLREKGLLTVSPGGRQPAGGADAVPLDVRTVFVARIDRPVSYTHLDVYKRQHEHRDAVHTAVPQAGQGDDVARSQGLVAGVDAEGRQQAAGAAAGDRDVA